MSNNEPTSPPSTSDAQPAHQRFTRLVDTQLSQTLGQQMVPIVDSIRDLNTAFGIRPYEISRVRAQWSGGRRGVGVESVLDKVAILPTPQLLNFESLTEIVQSVGLDEVGEVRLTEISGRFEEDFFFGRDSLGNQIDPSMEIFFEIEFGRLDGRPGVKRRFFLTGAPHYDPEEFCWNVNLRKSHQDRTRDGFPR